VFSTARGQPTTTPRKKAHRQDSILGEIVGETTKKNPALARTQAREKNKRTALVNIPLKGEYNGIL